MDTIKCNELKNIIFSHLNFNFDGEINFIKKDGVYAKHSENGAVIGFEDKITLCRALFVFAKEYSKGERNFEIFQKKHFKDCGVMVDCSRNAVLTVEGAKSYIKNMAALGLNFLMLYTEDTYEIKEYPYFGYLRGRYTKDEIKEITDYAEKFGIEVIPCIQTLAHLSKFLKWKQPFVLRDTEDILLVDGEETYKFIECAVKSVSEMFKSKRIHIGMDEAHNVGLGKFLDKFGFQNRFEIITRHLNKVVEICKKYGLEPMMWSDMFFRLASSSNDYYDEENTIPEETINSIPDVGMVYWDYYTKNEEMYLKQIKKHRQLKRPVIFAGGISVWYGHLPEFDQTLETSFAALKACAKEKIDTVFATLWGDDGNECCAQFSSSLLPFYSEFFYLGENCTEDDVKSASEFLTDQTFDLTKIIGSFDYRKDKTFVRGKVLLYSDILYGSGINGEIVSSLTARYESFLPEIKKAMDKKDANFKKYEFAYVLYEICKTKAELDLNLQKKYLENDTSYLRNVSENVLPNLKKLYMKFKTLHKNMWYEIYKPFGFEVLSIRYGGVVSRINDAIDAINAYLDKNEKICELCEKRLESNTIVYRDTTPTSFRW